MLTIEWPAMYEPGVYRVELKAGERMEQPEPEDGWLGEMWFYGPMAVIFEMRADGTFDIETEELDV